MEQENSGGSSSVFADLHEMFGACVPRNVINEIGNRMSWDVTSTVDQLIKYIEAQNEGKAAAAENVKIQYKVSESQENDRDLDVLIESESSVPMQRSDFRGRSTGAIKKQPRESSQKLPHFSDFLKNGPNVFQEAPKKVPAPKPMVHPLMEEICKEINAGIKVMIIMRGLPGSGKTYLGRKIVDETVGGDYRRHIFSSDNFFYDVNGVYKYDIEKLSEAHAFNQNCVFKRAYDGWSPIIVDNTNMKLWEMQIYCKYAVQFGYIVRVLEPTTPWAWNLTRLSQMNEHSVPRESIERMLLKYEKLNGEQELLATFQLSYRVPIPQFRHNPPFRAYEDQSIPEEDPQPIREIHNDLNNPLPSDFTETPQSQSAEKSEASSDDSPIISPERMAIDWPTHEEEINEFWRTGPKAEPDSAKTTAEVKEQRTPRKNSLPENSLLQILKESIMPKKENTTTEKVITLEKHRKGCKNENESFVQVRQIYPTTPIQYLWDIFVNCKGDSEWTVDLILQEETILPQLNESSSNNDFSCCCDGIEYKEIPWDSTTSEIPSEPKKSKDEVNIPTPQRQRNQRTKNVENEDLAAAKRHIEELISIKDEHYSDHVRKIRDIRRGIFPSPSTTSEMTVESPEIAEMGACGLAREDSPSSEGSDPEAEEVIEVDLGDTLINQMENIFVTDSGVYEKPKDVKTAVFMPVSLLRQLHALWLESLFNQLEEQRLKDLKEDEAYARTLQMQDYAKNPDSFLQDGMGLGDRADMEFTWEAYKREQWKDTTPKDLASQLTRAKLYETFPEADKGILDEILASNNYKFVPTVELLMQSLGTDKKNVKDNSLKIIEEIKQENDKKYFINS
ncbi:uncharacterized protein LOC129797910 isoform X2 [Phlebotomus papatasi]|uniref:uncharacterized protein LOC129797910 isoform X2 n=1 Tax=Phlebotomus papatasi TaxID=29031 RepID=UPI0024839DBD|nr:uncharacterized protein LOC129797910 isoform X2 [Phlebotomus papatasi]